MALADPPVSDRLAGLRREIEQPQGVADRNPALADLACDRLVSEAEPIDQLAIRERGLDRVQVSR